MTLRTALALLSGLLPLASEPAAQPATHTASRPVAMRTATPGAVHADVRVRYYDVAGVSEGDLLAAMLAAGPVAEGQRFFGLTTSELSYAYRQEERRAGCSLRDVQVEVAIAIVLPRWTPPAGTPYNLRRAWGRFAAALRRHEDGHRVLAVEAAERTRRMLGTLRAPTCDALDREAARRAEAIQDDFHGRNRAFDERTDHGRTQGANWPAR